MARKVILMKPPIVARLFFALLSFFLIFAASASAAVNETAVIYKNEACGHCTPYLQELKPFLEANGFASITEKNFINDDSARKELLAFNAARKIPLDLQGHMTIVLNNLVLEGHVPLKAVKEVFDKYPLHDFPELILYQDSMDDQSQITSYKLMQNNEIKECSLTSGIENCTVLPKSSLSETPLLLLVIITGFLAGIHPCTISVLLFFIAFLFTMRKSRLNIFGVGFAYILGVFLAYFLIGLGLLQAVAFTEPHFATKIAAILINILGLYNLFRHWLPKVRFTGLPESSKPWISGMVQKASIPSALVVGLFVGMCSFGCTSGIYISIISFLVNQAAQGILLLVVYNLMFILPLIVILFIATNARMAKRLETAEKGNIRIIHLITGAVMVVLGLYLLFFV
ncbi:hypothetical protein HZB89_01430 [archaeon]|nr:hypothetical protein [archaeon]